MTLSLFLTFLGACLAAGATGAMFQPGAWYQSLRKPSWTPPNWLFPVAWTTLYICMSVAGARIAGLAGTQAAVGQALAFWALQIALNTLWTPVFFGLKKMGAGLVVLILLWGAVAATLVSFWQLDTIAGLLFVPYLMWVSVAFALNLSVWRMNRA